MRMIERILGMAASSPHTKFNKGEVEDHVGEIYKLLHSLTTPSLHPGENGVNYGPVSGVTASQSGDPVPPLSADTACAHLIERTYTMHELPSLIEAVLSSDDAGDMLHNLSGDDAQNFADVMDEALETLHLSPQTRKRGLKALYRTCGRNVILPKSLHVPPCYDRQRYNGHFGDVWKGEHCGKEVAVKVIRTASYKHLEKLVGGFCKEVVTWKSLRHPNILPLLGVNMDGLHFSMVSEWMKNGNIDEFLTENPGANRLGLLVDAAMGLAYIHGQGMVHGDLKGANILIDQNHRARVADFSLLTMVSDPGSQLSSSSQLHGGTTRWMSPELIDPGIFGLKKGHRTKPSDCYAFGMVMYETISGREPFHGTSHLRAMLMALNSERPSREEEFADGLWEVMERCWARQPDNRPDIENVLRYLESVSQPREPPSEMPPPVTGGEADKSPVYTEADTDPDIEGVFRHSASVSKTPGPPSASGAAFTVAGGDANNSPGKCAQNQTPTHMLTTIFATWRASHKLLRGRLLLCLA
ncbi:kinase-like domain-containing protein [Thelephora terrestris]|uniref:Kinase-like domain-containing protein n=1 Tax=Thelephora terrestris TaxID=56493 RepID=A0A9P6HMC7_9AGAM|nr:kinase-like domain-containing protein [Thelephora terrestris]